MITGSRVVNSSKLADLLLTSTGSGFRNSETLRFNTHNLISPISLIAGPVYNNQVLERMYFAADGPYDFPEVFGVWFSPASNPITWVPGDDSLVMPGSLETFYHHGASGVTIELGVRVRFKPFWVKLFVGSGGGPRYDLGVSLQFGEGAV